MQNYSANYSQLYSRIAYIFKNPELLELALTHCSYQTPHNQRLEFLGDSVLGLAIADLLYERFPESAEGELTRMRSVLVRGHTLCALAEELKFAEFLKLGIGELKTGGRHRESILENSLEALIGAIFLDSDFKSIKAVIASWYETRLGNLEAETISPKDSKSRLQELLQKMAWDLPVYEVKAIQGQDHEQIFIVQCQVKIKELKNLKKLKMKEFENLENLKKLEQLEKLEVLSIEGVGSTRKSAEQEAANLMYQKLVNY